MLTSEQAKQLRALADRVEAATGPDRGLEKAVFAAFGNCNHERTEYYCIEDGNDIDSGFTCLDCGKDTYGAKKAPAYLHSTDAAFTLVPEGHGLTVGQNVHHWHWVASVNYLNREGAPDSRGCSDSCRGPAQAITAAALRARASLIDADTGEIEP